MMRPCQSLSLCWPESVLAKTTLMLGALSSALLPCYQSRFCRNSSNEESVKHRTSEGDYRGAQRTCALCTVRQHPSYACRLHDISGKKRVPQPHHDCVLPVGRNRTPATSPMLQT